MGIICKQEMDDEISFALSRDRSETDIANNGDDSINNDHNSHSLSSQWSNLSEFSGEFSTYTINNDENSNNDNRSIDNFTTDIHPIYHNQENVSRDNINGFFINEIEINNESNNVSAIEEDYELFDITYLKHMFKKSKDVMVIENYQEIQHETIADNINIILFYKMHIMDDIHNHVNRVSNETIVKVSDLLPVQLVEDKQWELRCIVFTCDSLKVNKNKWKGTVFGRHGHTIFPCWWKISSETNEVEKINPAVDILNMRERDNGKFCLAVFVRSNEIQSNSYRDIFLETIGGQSCFVCKEHHVPLVVTKQEKETILLCCFIDNICENGACHRKQIALSCPLTGCMAAVCSYHVKNNRLQKAIKKVEISSYDIYKNTDFDMTNANMSTTNMTLVNTQSDTDNYLIDRHSYYEFDTDNDDETNSDESINSACSNIEHDLDGNESVESHSTNEISNNDIAETQTTSKEEYNMLDIPCSSAGAAGGMFISSECKQNFIGSHVILNNCGRLLARRGYKLQGSKLQQRFMQSIVAKAESKSVPLLYPEALLFPSIFWKGNKYDSAPFGAIPCCLLAQDSTLSNNGFASLLEHFRSRITNTSLLTSTDSRYIAYCFDNFLNLQTRHTHSRLILHRGLWNSGLGKSMKCLNEPMFNVDNIDSRPVVNKLAAALGEKQATYFYTHTCNQQDHFGVRNIKQWIDSDELENIIMSKIESMKGLTQDVHRYRDELASSIVQNGAVALLRNWMEVSTIWMNYITNSKEKPLGNVTRIWWRHEYQECRGNLSHIHALIWIDENEAQEITLDRIRGSTLELIRNNEELSSLIDENILESPGDMEYVQEMGIKLLKHVCNDRCKRRIGVKNGEVKCRVTNNGKENPHPNQHSFKEYEVDYSEHCRKILIDLGLMHYDNSTRMYVMNNNLKAIKHFPPAVGGEGNISACNGRLFSASLSNTNLKLCTTYLTSRYLTKYIAAIDENNRVYLFSDASDGSEINAKMEFLYNTKITSSAMFEKKRLDASRNKHKPQGRAISLMEITSMLLGYPQVYTDIEFIHVPTVPLAERAATEKTPTFSKIKKDKFDPSATNLDDFDASNLLPQYFVRNVELQLTLPTWRLYTSSEILLMKDQMFSNLSIDNVTAFGLRPPELRFVRHIKLYYRWFYINKSNSFSNIFQKQVSQLRNVIKHDLKQTMWIDGCGRNVYLRCCAINEIIVYLNNREENDFYGLEMQNRNMVIRINNIRNAKTETQENFQSIHDCIQHALNSDDDLSEDYKLIAVNFLNANSIKTLKHMLHKQFPVVWFSSIKPSQGTRWLIHLLISMGEFDNEYNLYCQSTFKECFIFCKLISANDINHSNDLKNIARRYIMEQLNFIPGGSKQFDRNIISCYQTLQNVLLNNTSYAADIPPVLYTQLQATINNDCKCYLHLMKQRLLDITLKKLLKRNTMTLPLLSELVKATKLEPLAWNLERSITCGTTQTMESFDEQMQVLVYGMGCIKLFLSATYICNRNLIICGGPGVGKTTLLQLLIIHAASIGLNVNLTSIMSERSSELGGLHISKMFCIPTDKHKTPSIIAEKAVCTLLRQPKQFAMLQKLEILAVDEFGQVSAELLSVMDIILRTIRKNSLFMGGVYIVATMDNMQLPPVGGRPPLLSPHMLSSFSFQLLTHSVRASQDSNLQEIQQITRLNYNELSDEIINRFRFLVENHCTFVEDFNSPLLTNEKIRMFGKRSAKVIAEESLLRAKKKEFSQILIERMSEDFETTLESQWDHATSTTSKLLSQRVKEPRRLCFYPNAAYEITFNNGTLFSQGQIALLAKMPTLEEIQNFSPVTIFVAPDGCKTFPLDCNHDELIQQGWHLEQMPKCREHPEFLGRGIQAKRRQYGLRHRIASTIHAGMGQDLETIVTKVTDKCGDPNYHLWDKEQVVVLLSRTNYAKDIIFVGEKTNTSKALSDLLNKRSQYTEYTNHMLAMLAQKKENANMLQSMNLVLYPYRAIDFELPTTSSGYVYLLQSRSPYVHENVTYIGETNNLLRRLQQHNQLQGSKSTRNPFLLPWALICFITGFNGSQSLHQKQFEKSWQAERDRQKRIYKRSLTIEETCNAGKQVMLRSQLKDLRMVFCFSKTT